jgi:hypothetical protein
MAKGSPANTSPFRNRRFMPDSVIGHLLTETADTTAMLPN